MPSKRKNSPGSPDQYAGQELQKAFFDVRPGYDELPWAGLGATDSGHQVFFASNGKKRLAIKPYWKESPLARAHREAEMLRVIRKAGFLTFTPEAPIESKDGRIAFLPTVYVPNLRSMSSVVSGGAHNSGVAQQVSRTARTLGQLHAKGISHGDAQIKNFMVDPNDKKRILVPDPERGGTEEFGHPKNDPYQHDIDSLVQSLAYKRYGGTQTDAAGDVIIQDVLEPYYETISGASHLATSVLGETALSTFLTKHSELYR